MNKGNAINNAKSKIISIEWHLPHYNPSIEQQTTLSNQIVKKLPTELRHIERSILMKEVKTQNLWNFEVGTENGSNIPIWIIVGFQQSDREHDQNRKNNTFHKPRLMSAQCIIGTERYPDSAIFLNYDDDDCSQGYGQRKEVFRALTKDDILQPYILDHDFRSSIDGDKVGYNLYVFDIRYQKILTASQPIEKNFKFSETVPAGIYGCVFVFTNKFISKGSDGQQYFDLI